MYRCNADSPRHSKPVQAVDLQSVAVGEEGVGVLVQDTDLSYRLRVAYTQWKEEGSGWWEVSTGGHLRERVLMLAADPLGSARMARRNENTRESRSPCAPWWRRRAHG